MLTLKIALSFPRSGVGMQSEPLQRLGTQSVHYGIPTETVGTIKFTTKTRRTRRKTKKNFVNFVSSW